jgi:hypothetical protein
MPIRYLDFTILSIFGMDVYFHSSSYICVSSLLMELSVVNSAASLQLCSCNDCLISDVIITNDELYSSLFLLEPEIIEDVLIPGLDPPPCSSSSYLVVHEQQSSSQPEEMMHLTGGPLPGEPVYAQVNRDRKIKHHHQQQMHLLQQQQVQSQQPMTPSASRSDSSSTQALLGSDARDQSQQHFVYHDTSTDSPILTGFAHGQPAGDSWV